MKKQCELTERIYEPKALIAERSLWRGFPARESFGTNGLAGLEASFPDASAGQDLIEAWDGYSTNSSIAGLPAVRGSLRVYQRYIPINN